MGCGGKDQTVEQVLQAEQTFCLESVADENAERPVQRKQHFFSGSLAVSDTVEDGFEENYAGNGQQRSSHRQPPPAGRLCVWLNLLVLSVARAVGIDHAMDFTDAGAFLKSSWHDQIIASGLLRYLRQYSSNELAMIPNVLRSSIQRTGRLPAEAPTSRMA